MRLATRRIFRNAPRRLAAYPAVELALLSFLALYFEMVAIRWLASDIRVFAYLKNLPLLAAFLGLGLGCACARGAWFWPFPLLLLAFAAIVGFAGPLDLVHMYLPQERFWAWNDANFQPQQLPAPLLTLRFFGIVVAIFFLVVALFATLGARLGALFNALRTTTAYSINLLASLAGIWCFALLAWAGWPPAGWFLVGALLLLPLMGRRPLALGLLAATVLIVVLAPGATRWSPYYRIDLAPLLVPDTDGRSDPAGYTLTVNHDYHQTALNLTDEFTADHPGEPIASASLAYELPYRFVEPGRVLVVGAGMGNDVAAALRHGAERVDAVEIDPTILELGRSLHPERPYASPAVRVIVDDARSFFARADTKYDLIVFGLLDSHTLLASVSSLRLDSYVYTLESLEQARALLAPGGHVALSFATSVGGSEWLSARLYQMITRVFGEEPLALSLEHDVSTLYLVGPGLGEALEADPALAEAIIDPAPLRAPVPPAVDDWPFLYLREHGIPWLPYGATLLLVLLGGGGLVLATLRRAGGRLDSPMFFLGAAFMLVEVKSISQLSLLFGSTWIVNALIISAILTLALGANLFVIGWQPRRVGPAYALLVAALIVDYLVPLAALNGQHVLVRATLGSLLPVLPLLFSGVVFAVLFARTESPALAFGSNLLGALAGGLLEYVSMMTGFKALGVLALALYGASAIALSLHSTAERRQVRWRPRPASRTAASATGAPVQREAPAPASPVPPGGRHSLRARADAPTSAAETERREPSTRR